MENRDSVNSKDFCHKHTKYANKLKSLEYNEDGHFFSNQPCKEELNLKVENGSFLNVSKTNLPALVVSECISTDNQAYLQPYYTPTFPSHNLPPPPRYRQSHSVPAPVIPNYRHHQHFDNFSRGKSLGESVLNVGTHKFEQYSSPVNTHLVQPSSTISNNTPIQHQVSLPPITTLFRDIQMNEARRSWYSSCSSSVSDLQLYSPHTIDSSEHSKPVGNNDRHESLENPSGDNKQAPIDSSAPLYIQQTAQIEPERISMKNNKLSSSTSENSVFQKINAGKISNAHSPTDEDSTSDTNEQNKLKKLKQGRPITLDISVNLLFYESLADYLTFLIQKSTNHTFSSKKQHNRSKENLNNMQNNHATSKSSLPMSKTKQSFLQENIEGDAKSISISVDSSIIRFDENSTSKSMLINKQHYLNLPNIEASSSGQSITSHVKVRPIRKPLLILVQNQSDLVLSHIKAALNLEPLDGICLVKNYSRSTSPNRASSSDAPDENHDALYRDGQKQARKDRPTGTNDMNHPVTASNGKESSHYIKFDYIPLANEAVIDIEFFKKHLCYPKYRTNLKLVLIKKTPKFPNTLRVYLKSNLSYAEAASSSKKENISANFKKSTTDQSKDDIGNKKEKELIKEDHQSYTLEEFKRDKSHKLMSAMAKHSEKELFLLEIWKINKYVLES